MSGYDDLIPGPSPSRRRSAYDDLLPGGAPAATVRPAEEAQRVGEAAATDAPGLLARIRDRIFASAPPPMVAKPEKAAQIVDQVKALFKPKGPESVTEFVRDRERVRDRDEALLGGPRKPVVIDDATRQVVGPIVGEHVPMRDSTLGERIREVPGAFADAAAKYKTGIDILTSGGDEEKSRLAAEVMKRINRSQLERKARTMVFGKDGSVDESAIVGAADAAPSILAGIAGGIFGGLPGMAAAVAPAVAPDRYSKSRALGLDPVESMAATVADVAQEGATEKIGLGLLRRVSKLPAKVALARAEKDPRLLPLIASEVGIQQGGEHASEQVSNLTGWLLDKASGDPEATLGKLLADAKQTFEVTGILAPIMGGATVSGGAVRKALTPKLAAEMHLPPAGASEEVRPVAQPASVAAAAPAPEIVVPSASPAVSVSAPSVEAARVRTGYDDLVPRQAANQSRRQGELNFGMPADEETGEVIEPPVVEIPKSPVKLVPIEQLKDMRAQAATWARANIVDTTVKNAETGFDILIPWSGVKHTIGRNSYPEDIATIPAIPGMLETGKLVESGPDERGRLDIKAVHRFLSRAQVGEDVYRVLLTVRELKNGKRYYDHVAMQKETPSDKAGAEVQKATEYDTSPKGANENVDDLPDEGNRGSPSNTIAPPAVVPPILPGAATAAGAQPKPQSTVGKEQARPDAIRAAMRTLFGAPLSEKGLSKKFLGIYRVKPQTIRLQNRNDLRTASHEIGHHISELNRPFRKVMRAHQAELVSIAPRAYIAQAIKKFGSIPAALQNGDMRRHLVEEGFAEFIAELLTAPATLQAKVPGFYKAFEGWLAQNPKYAQALLQVQGMLGAHQQLSPEDKILAKVGAFKPPLGERVRSALSMDTWAAFAQATLDKWHPLKAMVADIAPGLAASKNPYAAARLLAGDTAIIEDWITDFTSPFDYAKRLDSKNYGKPLKAILEPVLKQGDEAVGKFKAYLIARRAAELKKVGKENLLDLAEIRAGLALETPEFKAVAKEVYAYNDRLLDYAVEGGLLSPEVAAKFREYANYIPFFRESESDAKGDGRGNPFKKLTGGTANLRDPIANLIQNTANIVHATNRNAMVAKAVALAKAVPGGGRWMESVKVPQEAHALATQRIIEQLQEQGVGIDTSMAQNLAAMQTFFTPSGKGDERTRTIVYKDGGDLKAAQINDPLLWKALGNIPPLEMNLILKMMALPAQTLRAGVVLDPTFMVRNFVRDTLSSMVQSKGAFLPVISTVQGMKMMAQQKDAYRLWRSFGGAFADQFREPEEAAGIIERMAKRGNFSPSSIITPTRWLDALKRVGSFTESGSRIGEFDATYKKGDIDSALEAALNSREVSTDFGMKGGHAAIQILTRITPFMNPAMQGLYKTARVLSAADGKKAAGKAAILGSAMALASVALTLVNGDEDWYQQIEEWEKGTYWHFKVGDNVYRIPKPFEYGTLFASIPEAIALQASGQENGEDFKKRMLQALGQVFGFRVIPQIATIIGEPWANKSIFTGRQLVPDRQKNLEPGMQATPYSSKVAQLAGEAANVSPAIIDNVVRNVFGTIGVHASTVGDLILEASGVVPPGREKGWQTWPAIKTFVRDPDNPNTKQQRDFYENLEKYRKAVNTVKELKNRDQDDKAAAYATEKAEEISSAKSAETASKKLAAIRKKIRAIEWSRDMTPAEKREAVRDHNAEMQDIAEEQMALYRAAKKSYDQGAMEKR